MGLCIHVDEEGNAVLRHKSIPSLPVRAPYEGEKDTAIMIELQRRLELGEEPAEVWQSDMAA